MLYYISRVCAYRAKRSTLNCSREYCSNCVPDIPSQVCSGIHQLATIWVLLYPALTCLCTLHYLPIGATGYAVIRKRNEDVANSTRKTTNGISIPFLRTASCEGLDSSWIIAAGAAGAIGDSSCVPYLYQLPRKSYNEKQYTM